MAVPAVENFDPNKVTANTDNEKANVLRALAQGGTQLAQQQATAQSANAAMQQAAIQQMAGNAQHSAVAGDPTFAAQQASRITGQGDYYSRLMGQQGASQQNYMSNLGSANSQYMDQVNAAVPIAHEQTQRQLDSLSAAASNAEADRAMKLQLQQLQLQETNARIAASAAANNPADAANRSRILQYQADHVGDPAAPSAAEAARQDALARQSAIEAALNSGGTRSDTINAAATGQPSAIGRLGPQAMSALREALVKGGYDENASKAALHTLLNTKANVNGVSTYAYGQPHDPRKQLDEAAISAALEQAVRAGG